MKLVIVESPAKAKTINRFLGKEFVVKASMGHLIDLPKSQLAVDPDDNFNVKYITIRGKGKMLAELRRFAKKATEIYLATDPDREGEAISWHLMRDFGMEEDSPCRVVFHEITRTAVKKAFNSPRTIQQAVVDAQQARRVLDRLVGYKISPILWAKVRKGLSAGRVQSAALNMICLREEEIQTFIPREYWTIEADLTFSEITLRAKLAQVEGKRLQLTSAQEARQLVEHAQGESFVVTEVVTRDRQRKPPAPFTTSTMQQEAGKKLGYGARKTMVVAQQLYEGISLGRKGTTGLITYMRTDSVRISQEFQNQTLLYLAQRFGQEYVPPEPREYSAGRRAQEAHEAVRPTDLSLEPDSIRQFLSEEQYSLYRLIWQRYVASQMASARQKQDIVTVKGGPFAFKLTATRLVFPGFLTVLGEDEVSQDSGLTGLVAGQSAMVKEFIPEQHFTQPLPRYSEALLVKDMEQKGIGRPSTYAPTIETLLQRGYAERREGKLWSTELGQLVNQQLQKFFPDILNLDFTAQLENRLDEIEDGHLVWQEVVRDFYQEFKEDVAKAEAEMEELEVKDQETDELCEVCGRNMVIKAGRFGRFLACPGFPDCRTTKPLLQTIDVPCPQCGGQVVQLRSKKGRWFYGCKNHPDCDFRSWKPPVEQKCPLCQKYMVEAKKGVVSCSDRACGYKTTKEENGGAS